MTEQTKPVLLTEAEAAKLYGLPKPELFSALRERGLIAPEPVDVALRQALNSATEYFRHEDGGFLSANDITGLIEAVRPFLAPRPLTREQVREGLRKLHWRTDDWAVETLHAALTEQVQQ